MRNNYCDDNVFEKTSPISILHIMIKLVLIIVAVISLSATAAAQDIELFFAKLASGLEKTGYDKVDNHGNQLFFSRYGREYSVFSIDSVSVILCQRFKPEYYCQKALKACCDSANAKFSCVNWNIYSDKKLAMLLSGYTASSKKVTGKTKTSPIIKWLSENTDTYSVFGKSFSYFVNNYDSAYHNVQKNFVATNANVVEALAQFYSNIVLFDKIPDGFCFKKDSVFYSFFTFKNIAYFGFFYNPPVYDNMTVVSTEAKINLQFNGSLLFYNDDANKRFFVTTYRTVDYDEENIALKTAVWVVNVCLKPDSNLSQAYDCLVKCYEEVDSE